MTSRLRPLLLVSSFAVLGLAVTAGRARATACGDEYDYVPTNAVVDVQPPTDCIEVKVDGANQPGCDQLELRITNHCGEKLAIDPQPEGSYCEDAKGQEHDCSQFVDGDTAALPIATGAEAKYAVHVRVVKGGAPIEVDASFDAVDLAASCSVAAVGAR